VAKKLEEFPEPPMTKREAVRQAIKAGKSKPTEGVKWIKENLGITIVETHFSINKSAIRKQEAERARRNGAPVLSGDSLPLDLLHSIKQLISHHGHARVRDAVTLFGD
jgi:hypothetical protein